MAKKDNEVRVIQVNATWKFFCHECEYFDKDFSTCNRSKKRVVYVDKGKPACSSIKQRVEVRRV